MIEKCYNKTHNKALRDGNLKGLLINNSLQGVIMTTTNNTCNIDNSQSNAPQAFYGVGCNSKRKHRTMVKGRNVPSHQAWFAMLQRCYCPKYLQRNPTYNDCSVDSRFHDFQDFADWYESHEFSNLGYQLDKDLLFTGNKIYSPDVCCFVPQELNSLLTDHRSARGSYPQGVQLHKPTGRYLARIRVNKKLQSLGYFDCPNEAHKAYKKAKEAYVKQKALEWQDRIADNVFQALMSWTLDS